MKADITRIPQKQFFEVRGENGEAVQAEFLMTFTIASGKWAGQCYMAFYVPTGSGESERMISFARANYEDSSDSEKIVLADIESDEERELVVAAFGANIDKLKIKAGIAAHD